MSYSLAEPFTDAVAAGEATAAEVVATAAEVVVMEAVADSTAVRVDSTGVPAEFMSVAACRPEAEVFTLPSAASTARRASTLAAASLAEDGTGACPEEAVICQAQVGTFREASVMRFPAGRWGPFTLPALPLPTVAFRPDFLGTVFQDTVFPGMGLDIGTVGPVAFPVMESAGTAASRAPEATGDMLILTPGTTATGTTTGTATDSAATGVAGDIR